MASYRNPSIPLPNASWIRRRRPQDVPLPPSLGHSFPDDYPFPVPTSSSSNPPPYYGQPNNISSSGGDTIDSQFFGPTPEPRSNTRSTTTNPGGPPSRIADPSSLPPRPTAPILRNIASSSAPAILPAQQQQQQPPPPPPPPTPQPQQLRRRDAAADLQAQRRADEIAYCKRLVHDRMRSWRLGNAGWNAWDEYARIHAIRRYPIPLRAGPWPGHAALRRGARGVGALWGQPVRAPGMIRRRDRLRWAVAERVIADARAARRVRRADEERREEVGREVQGRMERAFVPAGFRFKRRLGMGGCGAVYLFEMVGEDGARKKVVVKGSIIRDDHDAMREEKKNFVMMSGAAHFLQRVLLSPLALPRRSRGRNLLNRLANLTINRNRPLSAADQQTAGYTPQEVANIIIARSRIDDSGRMLLLEYLPRGTLYGLIQKVAQSGTRLSSRMLWELMHCLYRGLLAMAFPTAFYPQGRDPWREQIPPVEEWVPDLGDVRFWEESRGDVEGVPRWPLVHFDLDPENTLIGDFGAVGSDQHGLLPIVKISDPGLSIVANADVDDDEAYLWSLRGRGKPEFFTPEQFSTEWDYTASIDLDNLHQEDTAGNYYAWMNTYQIGWIMWSLITHHLPPFPPEVQPYSYPSEHILDDANAPRVSGWTYGWLMREPVYDHVDTALRNLIMRCLDHASGERPRLEWMGLEIERNLRREDLVAGQSDEQVRVEAERIFGLG